MDLVARLRESPKLFHSYIRRRKKGKNPVKPLKAQSIVVSDNHGMSELLVDSFSRVFIADNP